MKYRSTCLGLGILQAAALVALVQTDARATGPDVHRLSPGLRHTRAVSRRSCALPPELRNGAKTAAQLRQLIGWGGRPRAALERYVGGLADFSNEKTVYPQPKTGTQFTRIVKQPRGNYLVTARVSRMVWKNHQTPIGPMSDRVIVTRTVKVMTNRFGEALIR